MSSVTLDKVVKAYGDNVVVKDLSMAIEDREFVVLVGPSGCGKSTTLRMIAGLEEITDGDVRIGDDIVNDVPPSKRDIAMVFQSYALYPHMSVFENMAFGLRLRKMPNDQIGQRVREAAEILGIAELLERKPKQLSGGQRQRVAVGRAIVRKPKVFLFDEPLSNLDAKLRVQMRREITGLQKRLKTTTIYVTHDQIEAMTMGDRIAILHEGYLRHFGSPEEVYEKPNDLFTATFIGSPQMNVLRGTLTGSGRAATLDFGAFRIPGPEALDEGPITVGVRPEHVSLGDAGEGDFDAQVAFLEPLGAETIVYLRHGDIEVVAKEHGTQPINPGDTLSVRLRRDTLHFFDATTEHRIEVPAYA